MIALCCFCDKNEITYEYISLLRYMICSMAGRWKPSDSLENARLAFPFILFWQNLHIIIRNIWFHSTMFSISFEISAAFFSSLSLFSSLSWEYVHNDKPGKMWMRSNDYKPFYTCCQFSFKIKLPHTHTQSIIWHNILLALHTCFVSIFIYFFFSFLFSRGKSSVFPFSFFVAFFFIELDENLSCKKWWLYPF